MACSLAPATGWAAETGTAADAAAAPGLTASTAPPHLGHLNFLPACSALIENWCPHLQLALKLSACLTAALSAADRSAFRRSASSCSINSSSGMPWLPPNSAPPSTSESEPLAAADALAEALADDGRGLPSDTPLPIPPRRMP